eukprot:symbB.v1.2.038731.t1/scaffold6148.1/size20549/2
MFRRPVGQALEPWFRWTGRRAFSVNSKLAQRRKEFEEKAYPRLSTHEPKQLPRRGRRGGWMQDPQVNVPKLDGTNVAQRQWFEDRKTSIDDAFVSKLQAAEDGGMQEIFDDHLAAMDAVKISTPKADSFRLPHVARLAKTPKVNPVHAAAVQTPPVHVPASEEEVPEFLERSHTSRRGRRRGRFMGHRERRESERNVAGEIAGIRKASWLSDSDIDTDDEAEEMEETSGRRSRGRRRHKEAASATAVEDGGMV